jgi:hypothetical protein
MKRRQWIEFAGAGLSFWLVGPRHAQAIGALTEADATRAIRLALERGAVAAVSLLGRVDGFLGNPKVRIPLPDYLRPQRACCAGLTSSRGRQAGTSMNRALTGGPEAGALLVQALMKAVTLDAAIRSSAAADA